MAPAQLLTVILFFLAKHQLEVKLLIFFKMKKQAKSRTATASSKKYICVFLHKKIVNASWSSAQNLARTKLLVNKRWKVFPLKQDLCSQETLQEIIQKMNKIKQNCPNY